MQRSNSSNNCNIRKSPPPASSRSGNSKRCSPSKNCSSVSLSDVLDDLCTRFIINVAEEEYQTSNQLLFTIEEAYWFYVDFYRARQPSLPQLNFRQFAAKIFDHWLPLTPYKAVLDPVVKAFYEYKWLVPSYGALLTNAALDRVVLIMPFGAKRYSFPKGKINQGETELQCAVREVFEEIGIDLSTHFGLLSTNPGAPSSEAQLPFVSYNSGEQPVKLFIVTGIPERTSFATHTRKEISKIEWHSIRDILDVQHPNAESYRLVRSAIAQMDAEVLSPMRLNRICQEVEKCEQLQEQEQPRSVSPKTPRNNNNNRKRRQQPRSNSNSDSESPVANSPSNVPKSSKITADANNNNNNATTEKSNGRKKSNRKQQNVNNTMLTSAPATSSTSASPATKSVKILRRNVSVDSNFGATTPVEQPKRSSSCFSFNHEDIMSAAVC